MTRFRRSLRGSLHGALLLCIASSSVLSAGCGRKATSADCELIIDRNVEVQMKAMHIDDEPTIAKKQEELRAQFKDDMKDCEGRRVTDKMMTCVKNAQTGDEVTECLR
ncbi:MAG: hypothetical protein ACRELY_20965 [Polyangiaceae bacterium]